MIINELDFDIYSEYKQPKDRIIAEVPLESSISRKINIDGKDIILLDEDKDTVYAKLKELDKIKQGIFIKGIEDRNVMCFYLKNIAESDFRLSLSGVVSAYKFWALRRYLPKRVDATITIKNGVVNFHTDNCFYTSSWYPGPTDISKNISDYGNDAFVLFFQKSSKERLVFSAMIVMDEMSIVVEKVLAFKGIMTYGGRRCFRTGYTISREVYGISDINSDYTISNGIKVEGDFSPLVAKMVLNPRQYLLEE